MKVLMINAAFRESSRSLRLANYYLEKFHSDDDVEWIDLGTQCPQPLDAARLAIYNEAVAATDFSHEMFAWAKQFTQADVILIAAPFWNYSIPAVLHAYLELVCAQGVSFDILPDGSYVSFCKAKKLVYFSTAGGSFPDPDCGFGLIKAMSDAFWQIGDVRAYQAENLDIYGADVEALLEDVCAGMEP